jgi:hypothetical protein
MTGPSEYSKYLKSEYSKYLREGQPDYEPEWEAEDEDDELPFGGDDLPLHGGSNAPAVARPPVPFKNLDTRESKKGGGGVLVKRLNLREYATESTTANDKRAGGVRYLDHEQRKKYEVTLGMTIIRTAGGEVVDTKTIRKLYTRGGAKAKPTTQVSAATLGSSKTGKPFHAPPEWRNSLIWVVLLDRTTHAPRFYTHVCKVEKFHHSSFGAGKSIAGAGEWVIEEGKLKRVSANSGHYRPDLSLLTQAVRWMEAAHQADTQVFMYDKTDDAWVHRPVRDFLQNPGGGGRYAVHPHAV